MTFQLSSTNGLTLILRLKSWVAVSQAFVIMHEVPDPP